MRPADTERSDARHPQDRGGHTLIELLVVLLLLGLIIASVYAVLRVQQRFYATHVQVSDTRDAARIAVDVLSHELRAVSPAGGDLYGIARDSVALRSATGFGVICATAGDRLGLGSVSGVFGEQPTDSAMIFLEGDAGTALDDGWQVAGIRRASRGGSGRCADGEPPDLTLVLDRELAGAQVGSPVRAFRPYVYRLYRGSDGNWWLGQRLRGGRLQPLAGPFADPERGGLVLEPRTEAGAATTQLAAVRQVRVSLTARSHKPIPQATGSGYYRVSLHTQAYLRNGGRW